MEPSRPDLAALGEVYPRYLNAVVLHGLATAQALGMGPTDLYAMGALALEGRLTSGELAVRTGLTTGATTRLIDRLEQRGLVRRVFDPEDRRRVLVEAVESDGIDLDAALSPARRNMEAIFASFDPDQIAVLADYFTRAAPAFRAAVEEIRKGD